MKDQTWPRREISEVADGFIRIRRDPEAEADLLPIPSEMQPMLHVLRLAASGRLGELERVSESDFEITPEGWRVTLAPGEGPALRLVGCGRRLARIEVREPGGVERSYLLGSE